MTSFTPYSALIGGFLIGLAAVLLMFYNGRIAGISGIAGKLLQWPQPADWPWRAAFVAGLVAGPLVLRSIGGPAPEINATASVPEYLAAGLLVGFGSAFGSGCTSGHGVCGMARLSKRSLLATAVFMLAGILTVAIVRHWNAG